MSGKLYKLEWKDGFGHIHTYTHWEGRPITDLRVAKSCIGKLLDRGALFVKLSEGDRLIEVAKKNGISRKIDERGSFEAVRSPRSLLRKATVRK